MGAGRCCWTIFEKRAFLPTRHTIKRKCVSGNAHPDGPILWRKPSAYPQICYKDEVMWSQVMMRHVWKRIVLQCGKTAHDYILKEAQRMNIGLPASFSSEFWQVVLEVSEARPQIPVDISWFNKVIHDVWKPLDPFLHGLFQNRILPEFLSNLRASFTGMGIETCTL